jgi:hypothetical protein
VSPITPLRVKLSPGPSPVSLVAERSTNVETRAAILSGLSDKERMLVNASVTALEHLGEMPEYMLKKGPAGLAVTALLRAFQDATGVKYVGSHWDTPGV